MEDPTFKVGICHAFPTKPWKTFTINTKEDDFSVVLLTYICIRLLADSSDTWKFLALEVLEHCTTTGRYVAYLVSEAHLSYSCN